MQTPPASIPDLYKTAGQRYALRDLGLISQEEFEKEAWIPAAIGIASSVLPAVWKGVKGLFSRGGKGVSQAAQTMGQTAQRGQQALQAGRQAAMRGSQAALPRPPTSYRPVPKAPSPAVRQPYGPDYQVRLSTGEAI